MKQYAFFITFIISSFIWGQSNKPNIIFILADDLGYGDLGCYGQKDIYTPNIDKLAQEGMRFTQAYAGSPVCAPSRATIMTGQHTGHTHVRGNKEYWKNSPKIMYGQNKEYSLVGQEPYDANHIILPEIMKKNGYTTAMFGKWAGGYEGSHSVPEKRGVDEFFGYICQFQAHSHYPNFLNRYSKKNGDTQTIRIIMEENIKYPMGGENYYKRPQYAADIIHQKALEWLEEQNEKTPFYGFFTYTLPHAELVQPNDSLLKKYKKLFFEDKTWGGSPGSRYQATTHTHAQFAAMVSRLDCYVGEIIEKLKEKGLDKNTIIIFSSDNGSHKEGGADPEFFGKDNKLKGTKRQCYEGGIRVPFIVKWSGKVKPNTVNNHQIAFYDMMPTFAEMVGDKKFPKKYFSSNIDGISFLPTLLSHDEKQKSHQYLYWEFHETDQIAVRKGDWKLIVIKGIPHLYNLATDISENQNIASQHPEIVRNMIKIIRKEHTPSEFFKVTLPEFETTQN